MSFEDDSVIVIEHGGFVYVYGSVEDAEQSIEGMDVQEGHYVGAFTVDGERLDVQPDGLFTKMSRTGLYENARLIELLSTAKGGNVDLADNPREYVRRALKD